ncbi:Atlastin-1 [Stylophora pistillata]|uniref:Atlastin-1 n=1 Tax=Stylophora pistillata TaxID=50429 RepID=A0A2B4R858_STYPI|nr:Atlastin-1 [Stylophora pistillata]
MTDSQNPVKEKNQPDQKFKLWQEEKTSLNVRFVLLPCAVAILAAVVGVLITISVKQNEAIKSIEATGVRIVSALVNVTRADSLFYSCKEIFENQKSKENKAYVLLSTLRNIPVYCHMTDDLEACGGGGWTLVMKIDGNKSTFHYDTAFWKNTAGFNLLGGRTGFDHTETKLATYWSTPFSKICLGMKIDKQLNFTLVKFKTYSSSLHSLIATDGYTTTSLGVDKWKNLLLSRGGGEDKNESLSVCLSVCLQQAYMKIFQGEELPQPKSMLLATAEANNLAALASSKDSYSKQMEQATAEANNLAALASSKDSYSKQMEQLCGGDTPYLAPHKLEKKHQQAMETSLAMSHGTRKMGGREFSQEYAKRLKKEIGEAFENFVKLNDGKNIFNAARTPAVFFTLVVLEYFLSSVFGSIALVAFVRMCNLVIWSGLLAIVVWSYIRFSGEFREYGAKLDHVAEVIWDEAFMPAYNAAFQRGVQAVMASQPQSSRKTN